LFSTPGRSRPGFVPSTTWLNHAHDPRTSGNLARLARTSLPRWPAFEKIVLAMSDDLIQYMRDQATAEKLLEAMGLNLEG